MARGDRPLFDLRRAPRPLEPDNTLEYACAAVTHDGEVMLLPLASDDGDANLWHADKAYVEDAWAELLDDLEHQDRTVLLVSTVIVLARMRWQDDQTGHLPVLAL